MRCCRQHRVARNESESVAGFRTYARVALLQKFISPPTALTNAESAASTCDGCLLQLLSHRPTRSELCWPGGSR